MLLNKDPFLLMLCLPLFMILDFGKIYCDFAISSKLLVLFLHHRIYEKRYKFLSISLCSSFIMKGALIWSLMYTVIVGKHNSSQKLWWFRNSRFSHFRKIVALFYSISQHMYTYVYLQTYEKVVFTKTDTSNGSIFFDYMV